MTIPVMSDRRRKRLILKQQRSRTVINVGEMDIWDGADLALIRDTLHELIEEKGKRQVGIEMGTVKYVPSGFFGMLSEWHDRGINITLHGVQPNVQRMLWFRHFFLEISEQCYELQSEPIVDLQEENFAIFDDEEDQDLAQSVQESEPSDLMEV